MFLVPQFFLDDEDVTSISWLFQEIREIVKRRYALKVLPSNHRPFELREVTKAELEPVDFCENIAWP